MAEPARLRVLVGLTELAGTTAYTGGIGRSYAALLPALVAAGADVDLVLLGRDDPPRRAVDGLPFRVVDNGRPTTLPVLGQLSRALRLRRAFRRGGYDALLLPEWEGLGALLPARAPLITNLSTSIALIADVARSRPSARDPRRFVSFHLQSALEWRQIRRSRGLIGISRAIVDWNRAQRAGLPEDRVVRNTVDLDAVRRLAAAGALPAGWPDGPTLVFLGRLEERKGVRIALAAFDALTARQPDLRLVLIGALGDPAKEATAAGLLEQVRPEARSRVHLLGHLAGAELYGAVAAATVVTTPSLWEGFGNVALEVKACGAPLVATSGSGFAEFSTDDVDALLVPPSDAAGLAAAVERVLVEPGLRERLVAAGSASLPRFEPAPVAADVLAAMRELLG